MNSKRGVVVPIVLATILFLISVTPVFSYTSDCDDSHVFCGGAFDAIYPTFQRFESVQNLDASKAIFPPFPSHVLFGEHYPAVTLHFDEAQLEFSLVNAYASSAQHTAQGVVYENVHSGIDIIYATHGQGIKEVIVLKEPRAAHRVTYKITSDNIQLAPQNDGSVALTQHGEQIGIIDAPFMVDAIGEVSHAVHYELHGNYLDVIADSSWIQNAVYPIMIDPTVTLNGADSEILEDTYAYDNNTVDNSGSISLFAGSAFNSHIGSYLKFNISEFIGANRTILSAELLLYHFDDSSNNSGHNYTVFNVSNQTWSENACFNQTNCPSIGSIVNVTTPDGADNANYTQSFDITQWMIDSVNLSTTFMSMFVNRTYDPLLNPDFDRFASKEHSDTSRRPGLRVTYFDPCTPQVDWVVNSDVLCENKVINSSSLFVNITGTLIFKNVTYNQTTSATPTRISGAWTQESSTSTLHTNISVNGSLTLNHSEIRMSSVAEGLLRMDVDQPGTLTMLNQSNYTNIETSTFGYSFIVNGTLSVTDSLIRGAGTSIGSELLFKGIFINTHQATIHNSTIQNSESTVNGIVISGHNTTITDSLILMQGLGSLTQTALLFNGSSTGARIAGNNVTVEGGTGIGIHALEDVTNATFANNSVLMRGDDSQAIRLEGASNNTLWNHTINLAGDTSRGVHVLHTTAPGVSMHSFGNVFTNTTVLSDGDDTYGVYLFDNSSDTFFYEGSITTDGSESHGIIINRSNTVNFSLFTISASGVNTTGLIVNESTNVNFEDTLFTVPNGTDVVLDRVGSPMNLTFVGTTFNKNDVTIGNNAALFVNWKLDVTVTNRRDPLNNSNITIKNRTGEIQFFGLTDVQGIIPTQVVLEYHQNNSNTYHIDNYSVEMNYTSIFEERNLTMNQSRDILIEVLFPCGNPTTGDWVVLGFAYCNSTTIVLNGHLNITAPNSLQFDNVTLIVNSTTNGEWHIHNFNYFRTNNSHLTAMTTTGSFNYEFWNTGSSELDMYNTQVDSVGLNDAVAPYRGRGIFMSGDNNDLINITLSFDTVNNFNRGLNFYQSSDNQIMNSTFSAMPTSDSIVVFFGNESNNNMVAGNTFGVSNAATNTRNLYLFENQNNTILNNIIDNDGSFSASIYFSQVKQSAILGNTLTVDGFDTDAVFVAANSDQNTIANNSITTTTRIDNGIYIINSMSNSVLDNVILTTFDDSHGIFISQDSGFPTVIGNIVNTTGDDSYAFYSDDIANASVDYNNFSTSGTDSYGMYIRSSRNSVYRYNDVFTTGTGAYGAYLYFSQNIVFINNTINSTNADSIVIEGNAPTMYNHTFTNNTVINKSVIFLNNLHDTIIELNRTDAGILYLVNSNNVTVRNVSIMEAYGVNILFTDNSTIEDFNVTTALDSAIRVDQSKNMFAIDSIFSSTGTDVIIREIANISFVNSSFTEGDVSFTSDVGTPYGTISKMWYLDIQVNDSEFNYGVPDVMVNISDINTNNILSDLTNNSGYIDNLYIREYTQNTSTTLFFNNHTINFTHQNYFSNQITRNITNNTFISIDLILAISNALINLAATQETIYAQNFNFSGNITDADLAVAKYIVRYREALDAYYWNQSKISAPSVRKHYGMIYDSNLDVAVIQGGTDGSSHLNDTWIYNYSSETWNKVSEDAKPRSSHAMAFDYMQNVAILFGGSNGTHFLNDTWEFTPNTTKWAERPLSIAYSGLARDSHALVYVPNTQATYLFGGFNGTTILGDTWSYNSTAKNWTALSPGASPPARRNHSMVYLPNEDLVMLFGGYNGTDHLNDTWFYSPTFNTWSQRTQNLTPSPRSSHAMTYYSVGDAVVVFGGHDTSGLLGDTWHYNYSLNNWTRRIIQQSTMNARDGMELAYDSNTDAAVLLGGDTGSILNDTWRHYGRFEYQTNTSKNWTNGTLIALNIPTNTSLNVTLLAENETLNATLNILYGRVNESYLEPAQLHNRSVINVTRLVALNIFGSQLLANNSNGTLVVNQTINTTHLIGSVLNVTNLSSQGIINSSFFIIEDLTNYSFFKEYDGIYLPVGEWEIEIHEKDTLGRNLTAQVYVSSKRALQQTLVAGNTSAIINGSDAVFYFDVKTKQYPYVRYFMNLTDGGVNNFDVNFAQIGNDTTRVNISDVSSYTGADLFTLNASTAASVPADVYHINGLFNELVRLYITPYQGLSAGQYTGTYGWGLDDAS